METYFFILVTEQGQQPKSFGPYLRYEEAVTLMMEHLPVLLEGPITGEVTTTLTEMWFFKKEWLTVTTHLSVTRGS